MKIKPVGNFNLNYMTKAELKDYLRAKTKIANTRLRAIEQKDLTKSSSAYQYLMAHQFEYKDITANTKGGQLKFRTSFEGMSRNELVHLARKVNDFNDAKTSTIKGIRETYPKGYKTFAKNFEKEYDMKAPTEDEMNEFWKNKMNQNFMKIYGSQEAVKMLNASKSKPETLTKLLKTHGKEIKQMAKLKSLRNKQKPTALTEEEKRLSQEIWDALESGL